MHRVIAFIGFAAAVAPALGCSDGDGTAKAAWPRQPIQITCFASAGGGTDTVDRMIARSMAEVLGVRITVVNKPGANGGLALRDVWSRKHDGYRWGGFSESILPASVMEGHDTTAKDWTWFIVSGAPGVLSVSSESSKYGSLEALVKAAKAAPGTINAAAGVPGGLWHTKLLALEKAAGIRFNFVPFKGSNPSQLAALSGEVEVVLTSVSEQAELIKGVKLSPLAMIETEPFDFPGKGKIPAAAASYPDVAKVPVSQWLGFALPADAPPDVLARIAEAFGEAMRSPEIREMNEKRLLTPLGLHGEEANRLVQRAERVWTWMLHDLGIAKRSPEELGIPRLDDSPQ